jgi:hypothetical protein
MVQPQVRIEANNNAQPPIETSSTRKPSCISGIDGWRSSAVGVPRPSVRTRNELRR